MLMKEFRQRGNTISEEGLHHSKLVFTAAACAKHLHPMLYSLRRRYVNLA